MPDTLYTNGVLAVKERALLKGKLLRFCEMTGEEVLRALSESGFGSGAEGADGESLCLAEERALDGLILGYAPSRAVGDYLLAPRDFHNAKALVKAAKLGVSPDKLLAPEGKIPLQTLREAVEGAPLAGKLGEAIAAGMEGEHTGAELGAIFDRALFAHLKEGCRFGILKKLLAGRADRTNILIAMRAGDREFAESLYVGGGTLTKEQLGALFENRETALKGTPYGGFLALCLAAKDGAYSEAERALESFEAEYFFDRRYELERQEPFLYYVFCRRAEIANVRIILVCLNAGLKEQEIKKRLRGVY